MIFFCMDSFMFLQKGFVYMGCFGGFGRKWVSPSPLFGVWIMNTHQIYFCRKGGSRLAYMLPSMFFISGREEGMVLSALCRAQ